MRPDSTLTLALVPALALGLGLASAAHAQTRPAAMTDAQYVQASQCAALTVDHAKIRAFDALVRSDRKAHANIVRLEAQQQRERTRAAFLDTSGPKRRAMEARFAAECEPLLAAPTQQAQAAPVAAPTEVAAIEAPAGGKFSGMKRAVARLFGRD